MQVKGNCLLFPQARKHPSETKKKGNKVETSKETKERVAKRLGISAGDVLWYNCGSCYDKVIVSTLDAAQKVAKSVEGDTVNGGWFDGMPLGAIHDTGEGFEVMC